MVLNFKHFDSRGHSRNRTLAEREEELRREGYDQSTIDAYRRLAERIDPPVNGYDNVMSVPNDIITSKAA